MCPVIGSIGYAQLCGAGNGDVGSAPVSSNNICGTHDLKYLISNFSFIYVAFSS